MPKHFDDEVELPQILPFLCDFKPHQVVVRQLPRGRRLLCALRHQANVLLLVKHVHQHLKINSRIIQSQTTKSNFFIPSSTLVFISFTKPASTEQPMSDGFSFTHLVCTHGHLDVLLADFIVPNITDIVSSQF